MAGFTFYIENLIYGQQAEMRPEITFGLAIGYGRWRKYES